MSADKKPLEYFLSSEYSLAEHLYRSIGTDQDVACHLYCSGQSEYNSPEEQT